MKKINLTSGLLTMALLSAYSIIFFAVWSENENFRTAALATWFLASYMAAGTLTANITTKIGEFTPVVFGLIVVSPFILFYAKLMNLFDLIVLAEVIKLIVFIPASMNMAHGSKKCNSSQIFWRLVISTVVFDGGMFAIYNGTNITILAPFCAVAIIATWTFFPSKEEMDVPDTDLEKNNDERMAISDLKDGLSTGAIPLILTLAFLQLRGIYLAIDAPFEKQGQIAGNIIITMVTIMFLLTAGYALHWKLKKKNDSLWEEKKAIEEMDRLIKRFFPA